MPITKEDLIIGGVRRFLNGTSRVFPRQAGKLGYRLLRRPPRLVPIPQSYNFLEQAQQKNVVLAGIPTQTYHWDGKGPGVLLLHGWKSASSRWYELYEQLNRAGFSVYSIDAPAHGQSGGDNFSVFEYSAVTSAYLKQLPNPPIYWIGHSAGAMTIFYYLSQMNEAIKPKRIVSMAAPAELTDFIGKFQSELRLRNKVLQSIESEFIKHKNVPFRAISPVKYVKDIDTPGLIINDIEDDLATIEGAETLYRNWKNASLIITEGLGHSLEGPEIVELIAEYLLLADQELQGEI